jgi:Domain of unknown function (DUF4203)
MDLIVALIAVAVGLVACFFGYRLFRAVLPIFGFVVGAIVGAQAVFLIFDEGIFVTLLSIIAAVAVGVVFGLLAYFWWALGIVLVVGGMGFAIGNALLPAINVDNLEFVSWLLGLAVGAGFALAAIVLRLPRAIVIAVTALWGAGAALGGLLIVLQQIEPEELGYGAVDAVVSQSFVWLLIYLAVAAVGAVWQAMTTGDITTVWTDEPAQGVAPPPYAPGG